MSDWEKHVRILRDFFERVRKANLFLKPSKCKIGFAKVDFLGHTFQKDTISPQVETVEFWTLNILKQESMLNFIGGDSFLLQVHS